MSFYNDSMSNWTLNGFWSITVATGIAIQYKEYTFGGWGRQGKHVNFPPPQPWRRMVWSRFPSVSVAASCVCRNLDLIGFQNAQCTSPDLSPFAYFYNVMSQEFTYGTCLLKSYHGVLNIGVTWAWLDLLLRGRDICGEWGQKQAERSNSWLQSDKVIRRAMDPSVWKQ